MSDLGCLLESPTYAAHVSSASARCRVCPRCSLTGMSLSDGSVFLGCSCRLACGLGSGVALSGVTGEASIVIRGVQERVGWLSREVGGQQAGGALSFLSQVLFWTLGKGEGEAHLSL